MSWWKQLRLPLLMLTFANVVFVLGQSILDPNIGKRRFTTFEFPAAVPLPSWQLVATQPLANQIVEQPSIGTVVFPGRQYRYRYQGQPLEINMRYELETDGDVQQSTTKNTAIQFLPNQPTVVMRQQASGFYGLFVYQQRAYLNACINPRGGTTMTPGQFDTNRMRYDLQLPRLVPWLLGQQGLRDNRCLWTQLSVPLQQSSPQVAFSILEQAWFDWHQWWQPRFPHL